MNSTEKKKEEILVWNSKENEDKFWNPELGELDEPEGWDFLPSGDIFLTRTVKKIGPYWVLLRRMKKYTITVGILCPSASIEKAKKIREETESERKIKRVASSRYREKTEEKYRLEIKQLAMTYLDFSPEYKDLSEKISTAAAKHATEIGTGRVGRTKKIDKEERAILAVRAYIRHNYTDYDEKLAESGIFGKGDREIYGMIKGESLEQVDEFIMKHRGNRYYDSDDMNQ